VVDDGGGARRSTPGNHGVVTSLIEIQVAGALPQSMTAAMRGRFGPMDLVAVQGLTAVHGHIADQAALRAMLCLIWDGGCSVLSVVVGPDAAS
jgi:hypothetical protein